MKGLILAGGRGTRLRPLTRTLPKQLIPVANRPILHYVVDQISNVGITEIGVIISPKTGLQIQRALEHRSSGVEFTFIEQDEPLGLAHAVLTARDFLADDPFLMYLGDNLIGGDLQGFLDLFRRSNPAALILLKEVEDPRLFGVARLNGSGRVIGLVEKPKQPPSNLALVGIYAFSPRVHQEISRLQPSCRGELEITDALQLLIDSGQDVRSIRLHRWWLDTGKSDDLLEANRVVLGDVTERNLNGNVDRESKVVGNVQLAEGADVEKSVIHGPTVIGSGTRILFSSIGPHTSIGRDCTIARSAIGNSVVLDGATIEDVSLTASLVGADAEVAGSGGSEPSTQIAVEEGGRIRV
jgi:glucose-1-phosphate thymidylyltransferase